MALYSSVSPMGSKPVKKKKVKSLVDDLASRAASTAQRSASGSYTSKNTTGNAHSGQMYRTVSTSKGVVHEYANGDKVLVKKSKKANPSRRLY